ncbi:MAG TPA: 4Fe-4S dicluster domain-containing protein [Bacteroidetes bacterium]|nr:4Fe-4S dicluster domain-containing protein [Bacteroidota bacterium]
MNPIYRYFRDIYLGVVTVSIGLWVTFRHLFVRAVTVQYPHQKLTYPPRARTMLVNDIDICNGDQQCVRACPVDIIHMKVVKAEKDEDLGTLPDGKPKRLHVLQFDVEMAKCVFCGLCVEVCPTGAIHWKNLHEEVTFDLLQTLRHWAKYPPEEVKRLLDRDAAAKAAKAAEAAKAAAQKAASQPATKEAAAQTKDEGAVKSAPEKKTEQAAKPKTPKDSAEKDGKEDA